MPAAVDRSRFTLPRIVIPEINGDITTTTEVTSSGLQPVRTTSKPQTTHDVGSTCYGTR